MGVEVTKLWRMHVLAIAVWLLVPPIGQHIIKTRLMQPILPEEPEQGVDLSAPADVGSFMQVGVKVTTGMVESPTLNSQIIATAARALPEEGDHANAATDLSNLQQREDHVNVYATDKPLSHDLRPNVGGSPETVGFAIYVKNFFGMTIRKNEFSVDIVVMLRWTDARVSKLVPAGTRYVTISLPEAENSVWLPDVVIANRAIGGQERISVAIDLHQDGTVVKTERLLLRVKQHFDVTAFPFDYQRPKIILSSATLMSDDLVLQAMSDKTLMGAKPGLFHDREFHFVSDETTVFQEVDGNLRKSRGKLVITLRRDWTRYLQTTILPEIFLILISFTVFWMPRATPFAMPRVATNLISFLTLMTLSINTANMLPADRAGMAWIELFADSMQMQNSLILFLNVFVDWVYCTLDLKELGEKMSNQLAVLFPLMGSVVVLICFMGRSGEHLDRMQTLIRLWMFGVQATWIWYSFRRVREAEKEKEEAKS